MEFIRSWKFSFAIFLAIAVLAIVGVALGVTGHREPGFMPEGPMWIAARTSPPGVCVRTYSRTISDEGPLASDPDLATANFVIRQINDRLGFEMYRLGVESCEVTVTFGAPTEREFQEPGGSAVLIRRAETCDVTVANVTGEMRVLVLYHELGHCAGLAHDEEETSIMRPTQSLTPRGDLPPWFSDSDRDTLRHVYGGQW